MEMVKRRPWLAWMGVVAAMLLGVLLRSDGLAQMQGMLHFDEAYNGLDALSLVQSPRLVPFFPDNFGRDSGYIYLLAPAVALFDLKPFALRLVSVLIGAASLAAIYALARQVIGRKAAPWALAALGVLYFHVHLSHLVLRGLLMPLVGALAAAVLWRAARRNRTRDWLLGGVLTGLLTYTYFSAPAWIAYLLLTALWWARQRERRRGALLAVGVAVILMLPALLYTVSDPEASLHRVTDVAALDVASLWHNGLIWLGALLGQGDATLQWNVPGRPLLDAPLAILCLAGLVALVVPARWRRGLPLLERLWLVGLALVSVAPSLLSDRAPHFLRAIGLVVPVALVAGLGAVALGYALRRGGRLRWAIPILLVAWAGADSLLTFQGWLQLPEVFTLMEQPVHRSVDAILADDEDATLPVYFAPFTPSHPIVRYSAGRLEGHPTGAFDANVCQVVSDGPALYIVLDMFQPYFASKLARWGTVTTLARDPIETPPRYSVYRFTPEENALRSRLASEPTYEFGGIVEAALTARLPERVRPGSRVTIQLAFRAQAGLDRPYSAFIHLYGLIPATEGGPILAQGDSQICVSYPSSLWRMDETIVQTFTLHLPDDLTPGVYTLAMGIYESPTGPALPITSPADAPYITLQRLIVAPHGLQGG